MADTLVNLATVPIYGRDPKFLKHKISKNSFAQWAIDVKHILKSYQVLAQEKLLPQDAITPSAKKAALNEATRELLRVVRTCTRQLHQ